MYWRSESNASAETSGTSYSAIMTYFPRVWSWKVDEDVLGKFEMMHLLFSLPSLISGLGVLFNLSFPCCIIITLNKAHHKSHSK